MGVLIFSAHGSMPSACHVGEPGVLSETEVAGREGHSTGFLLKAVSSGSLSTKAGQRSWLGARPGGKRWWGVAAPALP